MDALNAPVLSDWMSRVPKPHPKGFQWLLNHKNANLALPIHGMTITASSHIGTITCSPPGQTGIYANKVWLGDHKINGFSAPFPQETFIHHLKAEGYKVASVSYPSVDCVSEARCASLGTSYNNQTKDNKPLPQYEPYPPSFQSLLEKNHILSPMKPDKRHPIAFTSYEAFVQSVQERSDYLFKVARFTLNQEKPDALLFYLEDIDTLSHKYLGIPEARKALDATMATLDQTVGGFIESLPETTDLVIMGDHGMSRIDEEININPWVTPHFRKHFHWELNGGSLLGYGTKDQWDTPAPVKEPWFQQAVQAFQEQKKYVSDVIVKGSPEAKKRGLDGPQMPWIIVFMKPGFVPRYRLDETLVLADRSTSPIPVPSGNHGHAPENPELKTMLILSGPHLKKSSAQDVAFNTDVVGVVGKALDWPVPKNCDSSKIKN